mmetsp:Transcript_28799/g.42306  ORF Transcript_28799/g.42306 Transcript_28799/m.42306 type:complete len:227 (+) Transcript_28799:28-708(+)
MRYHLCNLLGSRGHSSVDRRHSLIRKLVFLIKFAGLLDCFLDQISDNSKSSHSTSNEIVLLVNLVDLGGSAGVGRLQLLKSLGLDITIGLYLFDGLGEGSLCLREHFIFAVQFEQVVENFDGSLADCLCNLSDLLTVLGGVVSNTGSDGSKHRSSDNETGSSSKDTGGELDGILLDGNQLSSGGCGFLIAHAQGSTGLLGHEGGRGKSLSGWDKKKSGDAELHFRL